MRILELYLRNNRMPIYVTEDGRYFSSARMVKVLARPHLTQFYVKTVKEKDIHGECLMDAFGAVYADEGDAKDWITYFDMLWHYA